MIDLSTVSPEILNARGAYSTVRAAHEDAMKELQVLCGGLSSVSAQILRAVQKEGDQAIPLYSLIANASGMVQEIEKLTAEIESLAKQKADLKPLAWSR